MKRMFAPKHWNLTKLGGVYATRPSTGPHKMRQCIPLSVLLRNRLKYALSGIECLKICRDKENAHIRVDNKIRRDHRFPLGLMDVVTITKSAESFRILYDVKGRFKAVKISSAESEFKLCKVQKKCIGKNTIPYIVTHDGRTIRYPHPEIHVNDTIKLNLTTGDIDACLKFENGACVFIRGGNNIGRVGVLQHIEVHHGSYNIAHIKDANNNSFCTRQDNCVVIGQGAKPIIALPLQAGLARTLLEERDERLGRQAESEEEEEAEEDDEE